MDNSRYVVIIWRSALGASRVLCLSYFALYGASHPALRLYRLLIALGYSRVRRARTAAHGTVREAGLSLDRARAVSLRVTTSFPARKSPSVDLPSGSVLSRLMAFILLRANFTASLVVGNIHIGRGAQHIRRYLLTNPEGRIGAECISLRWDRIYLLPGKALYTLPWPYP